MLFLQLLTRALPVYSVLYVLSDGTCKTGIGFENGPVDSLDPEESCLQVSCQYLSIMEIVRGNIEEFDTSEGIYKRLYSHSFELTNLVILHD